MRARVIRKWRPPLWLVLGGTLAAVFFFPLIAIGYFRVAGGVIGWAEAAWMITWMAFVATAILGVLLWRLVLRPVRALTDFAQDVTQGATPAVPTHFGTPEFSRLGQSVLRMSATLQDREATVRSYADHVTHEMRSPLTVISGAAEMLDDANLSAENRAALLGRVKTAAARMDDLLAAQRALARAQEPMPAGHCMLSDVAGDAHVTTDGAVPLNADVMRLVLGHLCANARAHGASQVTLDHIGHGVTVSDDGRGISQGNRARIFDPFFTTRRGEGGTGMGLPIVRRMLEAQGATIDLTDPMPTTFTIGFDA